MYSSIKTRCKYAVTHVLPCLLMSKLAFAECLPGTEVTDRVVPEHWAGERINVARDDVTQIYASRAEMCGNLIHRNHDGRITGRSITEVYGWSNTTEDKLVFTVNVPTMEAGLYRVNFVMANNNMSAGNVFEISAPRTGTQGTLVPAAGPTSIRQAGIDYNRIEMNGLLDFAPGTNTIEVQLSAISSAQLNFAAVASKENNAGLKLFAIELIEEADYNEITTAARQAPGDFDWYTEQGKYGIMVHFSPRFTRTHSAGTHLSGGTYTAGTLIRTQWDEFIEDFNVEAFADEIDTMGGDYVVFTIFHGHGTFPGPSAVIDSIIPGRTASRDLIKDLGNELESRGKRLLLYFHALGDADWAEAAGIYDLDNLQRYNNNIIALHEEMANRYNGTNGYPTLGSTAVYVDAGYQGMFQRQFPYRRLIETIKAPGALPNAVIGLSYQHVLAPTMFSDVIAQDNREALVLYNPLDLENRTGNDVPLATRGTRIAGITKQQGAWPTFAAPTGWSHPTQHAFDHTDSALSAYINYTTGMEGMVYVNSIIAGDVRANVPFLQPAAVDQMNNIRRAIAITLSRDIMDNSRFWDLNYSNNWEHEHSENAFGSTLSHSQAVGSSIETEFEGQEVAIYASTSSNGGSANVFIDGNFVETISTNAAAQDQVKVFEMTGLSANNHTLRLETTTQASFALDYIQFGKTVPAIDASTIITDDSDTYEIDYVDGSWNQINRSSSIGGTISFTQTQGAAAEFLFYGNGVEVFTQRGPSSGALNIFVDDQLLATSDPFSASPEHGVKVFGTASLTPGVHKLRVECAGPNSQGGPQFFCQLDSIRAITSGGRAPVDDADELVLDYSGSWVHTSRDTAFDDTISFTNQKDASVEFSFTGTGVQVLTQLGPNAGIMDFYINGKKVHTVDGYRPTVRTQRGVFYPSALTDATNTLKIVCTGRKNANSGDTFCNLDRIVVD